MSSIKRNICLREFTTFKVGGEAEYLLEAGTSEETIEGLKWAEEKALPV